MEASKVKLRELNTIRQCDDAVKAIEIDWHNVQGGSKEFFSGRTTYLTATAQKKVDQIEARYQVLCDRADRDDPDGE